MTIYDGRESFYQWDLNQKITSNTFAVGDKIHFFNMRQSNALVVKAYELDGKVVADVPNILLQNALALKVWRYEYGDNSAQTIEEQIFNVEQRAQPYDYFYTETELYELRKDVARAVEDADTAEQDRELAESGRKTAELDRETNETARATAENERVTAETARANAETLRANAESNRATAETKRVSSEQSRVVAEATRQSAELERQSAETLRQTTFEQSYNNVSNALKGSASGEVVRVDDVSPIEHTIKAKVSGKNLFNQAVLNMSTNSLFGITITYLNDEDCLLINGTATNTNDFCSTHLYLLAEQNAKYTITTKYVSGEVTVPSDRHAVAFFASSDEQNGKTTNWLSAKLQNSDFSATKALPQKYIGRYWFYIEAGVSFNNYKVKVQLEEGDTATEYTPYIDPTTVTVTRCGKNILSYPYADTTLTRQGITFTDNGDGSITAKGTATGVSYFGLSTKLNLGEKAITPQANGLGYKISENLYYNPSNGVTSLNFLTGDVVDKTFYPMVVVGDILSEYEPYNGAIYTPEADGTVEVASVSPTMTLLTDTRGVTIEAEYNRDANLVVADLQSQIDSLKALIEVLQG